jgi:hypothetical protein
VLDEVARESKNLLALKGPQSVNTTEQRPAKGGGKASGVGSLSRCKHCSQPGHSASLCPSEAAKKRNDVGKAQAHHAEKGTSCAICAGAGVVATDHREFHHEQAAKDYAGRSSPTQAPLSNQAAGSGGNRAGAKGGGKNDSGKSQRKGDSKGGGAKGGAAAGSPKKGVCFEMAKEGKCTRANCEYSHDQRDLDEFKKKKANEKGSGRGGGRGGEKGSGRGGGRGSGGGLSAGGSTDGEMRTIGEGSALRPYAGSLGDVVRITAARGRSALPAEIADLSAVGEDEFTRVANRPAGYTAQSRVYIGGSLVMPVLFDTGASCAGIREEEALEIVRFCRDGLDSKSLSVSDPRYPIKRLELVSAPEKLTGLAAGAHVYVKY